jgi:hypothetical protein
VESTGDGLRRFWLVRVHRESLQGSGIQSLSDWGSSDRRFKSCQPDAGQRRFPEIREVLFSVPYASTYSLGMPAKFR